MPQNTPAEILADAELLIAHVVRSGVSVDQALIGKIIDAKGKVATGTLTAADESALYQAVNTLAAKLAPVTAETLRACTDESAVSGKNFWTRKPFTCSHARWSVRVQRRWALFALTLLLLAQIYWLIGSNLISRIPSLAENAVPPAAPATGVVLSPEAAEKAKEEKVKADTAEDTRMWMLHLWSTPWRWIPNLSKKFVPKEDVDQFDLRSDFVEWGLSSREVLGIFQIYLLPLLYGWVGAMAYVLRRMIKGIQDMTYRPGYDVEFSLRVYLGVLAGVAIGWFFKPQGTNAAGEVSFASLTPFALSFLAGYSVELLFTAMDRMVGAFTEKKSSTTP
ncbi:MAG TPA: hypothetical protein VH188_09215 [Chthoniobacterales bacterium]|jgi:hypothetical protein|nr:hypothetical protein [Chthoniobacterales bacterium]